MSRLESADKIEAIVGAPRHQTEHLGRAVSAEQRVYVLHSHECVASGIDLRNCKYSRALDLGINPYFWQGFEDQAVTLEIDAQYGRLLPLITPDTPPHRVQPSEAFQRHFAALQEFGYPDGSR